MASSPDRRLRWAGFAAFTAAFAVLVAIVFWGTWSPDVAPVMPDCPVTYAPDWFAQRWSDFVRSFVVTPSDFVLNLFSPYVTQELRYAVGLYFAALAVAFFCRGRGLSRLASYGAGLLLAFSGYWSTLFSAGHLGWFQWMTYGLFAFGLVDRAVRKNTIKHWLLLGAVVAWAGFQQQDLWLLFTTFTSLYFIWSCVRERVLPWKGALVALVTCALIIAPVMLDFCGTTLQNRLTDVGKKDAASKDESSAKGAKNAPNSGWEYVTNWSMPPEDTLEFLVPRVHGDTSCPLCLSIALSRGYDLKPYTGRLGRPMNAPSGNYRQHSLYVGWALLGLALCGVVMGFRRRDVVFFGVAALVFYAFSLGRFFEPAYRLIYALPAGDLIRCPVKWHHLTEFCLAVLAGYGLESLLACRPLAQTFGARRIRRGVPVLCGILLVGLLGMAREDARYCMPMSVAEARRTGKSAQTTVLRKSDFANPQIAAAVRARQIVSLANYLGNPDYYLVEILQPFAPYKPTEHAPWRVGLGALSFLLALGVCAYGIKRA